MPFTYSIGGPALGFGLTLRAHGMAGTPADFDLIVREYHFLSLVERPGLLRANAGWLLEAGKPAEMAAICG